MAALHFVPHDEGGDLLSRRRRSTDRHSDFLGSLSEPKMYKKYSSDITQHGIKLIKCPVQEMKQWPEITVNDDLISELDDSGYR